MVDASAGGFSDSTGKTGASLSSFSLPIGGIALHIGLSDEKRKGLDCKILGVKSKVVASVFGTIFQSR